MNSEEYPAREAEQEMPVAFAAQVPTWENSCRRLIIYRPIFGPDPNGV